MKAISLISTACAVLVAVTEANSRYTPSAYPAMYAAQAGTYNHLPVYFLLEDLSGSTLGLDYECIFAPSQSVCTVELINNPLIKYTYDGRTYVLQNEALINDAGGVAVDIEFLTR